MGIGDATTTTEYDSLGRRTRSVSPLGRITDYGYVATGNLVSVTQYLVVSGATSEAVTSYTYDYSGCGSNLLRVTDAEGYATSYGYGAFDRLATETLHSGTSADPPESATRYYYHVIKISGTVSSSRGAKRRGDLVIVRRDCHGPSSGASQ